jgi:hypothetical protein
MKVFSHFPLNISRLYRDWSQLKALQLHELYAFSSYIYFTCEIQQTKKLYVGGKAKTKFEK